ncbi:Oxysterol-binding protein [Anaeromyces robustus]|uniref:Oxysterol-binding protein n=1 Tax=Anaeromyces robustus TaxID=1754192 RepID=A0A1Y1WUB3_9FUNG|nr:Oxysterol-binding protein [Anaeromyces robustus]|eukprot:ORX77103.1 Oxysterol-binding protein [Anaeromyces robustus]
MTSNNLKAEASAPVERRKTLPAKTIPNPGSFFSFIRKNIGKDLSRISMPVTFNEPINLLQKLCEELEYTELLKNACNEAVSPTEYDRLMYVGAFALSAYAGAINRSAKKPFNPLLGETYENIRDDKGFRFISEKVSHHPPIMACYAESDDFIFFQDNNIKTKYWGNTMECISNGVVHLILKKFNEHYTWEKPNSVICKFMFDNRYLEYRGELKVTESNSGNYFNLKFLSSKNGVSGGVYTSKKKEMIQLVGNWDKVLFKVEPENKLESIWSINTFPPNCEDQYGFGQFTVELNEITPDIKDKLPPTDTRFRPDQKLYEEGKADEASAEKDRLEQSQREYLKERELKGIPWEPKWFELKNDPVIAGVKTYQYKGGYFEQRGNITVERSLW